MKIRKYLLIATTLLLSAILSSCYCQCDCKLVRACNTMRQFDKKTDKVLITEEFCLTGDIIYQKSDTFEIVYSNFKDKYDTGSVYVREEGIEEVLSYVDDLNCDDAGNSLMDYYKKYNYTCGCDR